MGLVGYSWAPAPLAAASRPTRTTMLRMATSGEGLTLTLLQFQRAAGLGRLYGGTPEGVEGDFDGHAARPRPDDHDARGRLHGRGGRGDALPQGRDRVPQRRGVAYLRVRRGT